MQNDEKWSNTSKNLALWTPQDFKVMFDHFTSCTKGLSLKSSEY